MNINAAAMLEDPKFRYTIRTVEGRILRKNVVADRFLVVRRQYVGQMVRVDVTHMDDDSVQTWNLSLTKWFGSN